MDNARKGSGEFEAMRDWLPVSLSVSILRNAVGAGGIRPVGRFAFFANLGEANLGEFEQKFRIALNSALAIEKELATQSGEFAGKVTVDTN
ncbi:MAG: tubulin-like doman-containing protein, partial [Armatimonadetes bacterium]|nr:tubulin-like doman-containing protein [Armatimonadota bacterium]